MATFKEHDMPLLPSTSSSSSSSSQSSDLEQEIQGELNKYNNNNNTLTEKQKKKRRKEKEKLKKNQKKRSRKERKKMKKKQKKEAKKKDKEEKKKKRKRSKMVSKNNNNNGGEDFTEERRKRRKGSETHRSEANVFGYSNHKNPFNDPNLNKPFVWGKKDGAKILSKKELHEHRLAVVEEVEKVKRRREEREREREEREKAMEKARREREREQNGNNMDNEEKFHANILREKSFRRVNAGLPNIVDLFVNNIIKLQKLSVNVEEYKIDIKAKNIEHCIFELYMQPPIDIIKKIQPDELFDLYFKLEDLERSESTDSYRTFYYAIKCLIYKRAIELGISIYDEQQNDGISSLHDNASTDIHESVTASVTALLDNKRKTELLKLRAEMIGVSDIATNNNDNNNNNGDINDGFKTEVLKQIETRLNIIDVTKIHKEIINSHQKLMNEYIQLYTERNLSEHSGEINHAVLNKIVQTQLSIYPLSMTDENGMPMNNNSQQTNGNSLYDGSGSNMMNGSNADPNITNNKFEEAMTILRQEAELEKEDTGFGAAVEVLITNHQGLPWAEKYAPRKPKYFNRVRSGFDWSGYNRTHYDTDNPPPKIVQGYKFNIFYPDLINPKITPTYRLAPANDQDFCIIHFSAGPPYEDIAFRIVNKEWAKGKRRGFRCTFDRGILQLHFNFTRTRYRR